VPYVRTVKTASVATAVQIVYSSAGGTLPVIESFMAAHDLPDVTIVADAGMVSEANQKQIEAAGLSFILGMKIPQIPYAIAQWRCEHPGEQIPGRARVHPALARQAERRPPRPGHLMPVPPRPGPPHVARDR
jgi:hypothetical protein